MVFKPLVNVVGKGATQFGVQLPRKSPCARCAAAVEGIVKVNVDDGNAVPPLAVNVACEKEPLTPVGNPSTEYVPLTVPLAELVAVTV